MIELSCRLAKTKLIQCRSLTHVESIKEHAGQTMHLRTVKKLLKSCGWIELEVRQPP